MGFKKKSSALQEETRKKKLPFPFRKMTKEGVRNDVIETISTKKFFTLSKTKRKEVFIFLKLTCIWQSVGGRNDSHKNWIVLLCFYIHTCAGFFLF
jgi:hypothetical protein